MAGLAFCWGLGPRQRLGVVDRLLASCDQWLWAGGQADFRDEASANRSNCRPENFEVCKMNAWGPQEGPTVQNADHLQANRSKCRPENFEVCKMNVWGPREGPSVQNADREKQRPAK